MFLERNFLLFNNSFEDSRIILFGAPYDCTVSFRPGSRFAPSAIRNESIGIETYSPYLDKDLEEIKAHDAGDLDVVYGNSERTLQLVENFTESIISNNKIPFMIGGEHLLSLGMARALKKKHPDLKIIHFDAHTDLRTDYLGERLSHASVMRRIWELTGDNSIHQFGIRSGLREEFEWAKEHTILNKFNFCGLDDSIKGLKDKPVYFSIDIDVLDTSIMCGTGTPEAGGVSFLELLDAIKAVSTLNIVGCDLCELAPNLDPSGASTALACKLIREIALQL